MTKGIEHIGKKDVIWGYAATFFTVGAGIILLPFVLSQMSSEAVGLWNIFQTITALVLLLDFGFRPSFARNISYIFSGIRKLQVNGVAEAEKDATVDYSLLKGALAAMRQFYAWIALAVFALLLFIGTPYFLYVLQQYTGDKGDAIAAWIILCIINCYTLYSYYYDALLTGKGYMKRMQQITIVGQAAYILIAIVLIYAGMGLTAIVSAQLISTIIRRVIAYRTFYTEELKENLAQSESQDTHYILKMIMPNAVKVGLTNLGGFLVNQSSVLLGSAFLSLTDVAMYGITLQVANILGRCGSVYYQSHVANLAKYRAERDIAGLKNRYLYSTASLGAVYLVGGTLFLLLGNWALHFIKSDTQFLPAAMTAVVLLINFLEHNHATAAGFIMAGNKIPFFIPSLVSGAVTVALLVLFLPILDMGVWGVILAPGIAQICYQNWKWPSVVIRELWVNKEI